jgi:hypothetical protein
LSTLQAINQGQHPFGWMACSIVMGQITDTMKEWVLIDTASTVNVFCNKAFVSDIKKATLLVVHTNAGTFTVSEKTKLPWCDMDLWYDPTTITNSLSLAIMQEKFPIVYDNSKVDAFIVKTPSGDLQFKPLSKNLYVFKPKNAESEPSVTETNMLSTLKENKSFCTNQQIERAKQARALARALGCPSDADMRTLLWLNLIKDCPVVQDDVKLAEDIFGRDMAILKGKSTRKKPKPVIHDTIAVPKALKSAQEDITLCIGTFFVNRMPFLHTISDKIHYRTSQWVPDCESSTYRTYLKDVFKVYWKAGFKIKYVCADQEFEAVLKDMAYEFKFTPNIAAAQEHVPAVEWSIRVAKEQCHATFHGNPFRSLPRILMKSVVQECTRKLNVFPVKGRISDVYSPRTILHKVNLSFEHCRVPQLSYVLAHDEPNPTNSTQAQAINGIYMWTLPSPQVGHEVFNVSTGKVIQQRNVTVVPITGEVIKALEAWAKKDFMEAFKIENKHGIIIYDSMIAGVGDDDQDQEN